MTTALRITVPQLSSQVSINLPEIDGTSELLGSTQKTFELPVDIYLKDVCLYQNTYFSRYLEWQGMCREKFMAEVLLAGAPYDGIFLTKCAHQEYKDETFAFQKVTVFLNTFDVKKCSVFLLFRFVVDGKLVSAGYQQIVCADQGRQIRRFPDVIYARLREYEIQSQQVLPH